MKFFKNYLSNLSTEINNSPAFSLSILAILFTDIITSINGLMDIIMLTLTGVLLFINYKNYKKKY